jgi:hypothetical protein
MDTKERSLTGAISSIQSKEITTTVHSSLAQELQGKIAGLVIRQNTGGPGDLIIRLIYEGLVPHCM